MLVYVFFLGVCVFRPVVLQLIYEGGKDKVSIDQCPRDEVILPAKVTNLQRHNWNVMVIVWKYGKDDIYSYNGESAEHKIFNNSLHLKKLEKENVEKGDVSLHFSIRPPNGVYTCETTELSTEGSKIVEMHFEEDELFKAKPAIITTPVLLVFVNISEIIFLVKCLRLTSGKFISGYCIQVIGIILLLVGLCMFQNGNSWNPLQKAGLVVAVCPPLLCFLISDVLFICGSKVKNTSARIERIGRIGCFCCCALQFLFLLIATVGAIMCMQDCPPNLISEMLLIGGLLLYTIIEIVDIGCCCYCYWLEHKEVCSNQMVNATPNSNNAVECEPLSTKS